MINLNTPLVFIIFIYLILLFYFQFNAKKASQFHQNTEQHLDYIEHFLLSIPIVLQGGMLYNFIFDSKQDINFSIGYVMSGLTWSTLVLYWIGSIFSKKLTLLRTWLILAGILSTSLIFIFPPVKHLNHTELPIFGIHVIIGILGYSLLFLASLMSIFTLIFQNKLKNIVNNHFLTHRFSLLGLEKSLFKLIFLGFGFLTLTLFSGILFSQELFHVSFQLNHKNILSILAWIVLSILVLGRTIQGWRGSKMSHWLLSSFGILTLGYLGSKFVLEIILNKL